MLLYRGEPAPWVTCRSPANERYHLAASAGRYIVMAFIGSATSDVGKAFLNALKQYRSVYDDDNVCLFIVTNDPEDEAQKRLANALPGIRIFWDFDKNAATRFRAITKKPDGTEEFTPHVAILDWRLRTLDTAPLDPPEKMPMRLVKYLSTLPKFGKPTPANVQAPILVVPNVFEKEFCEQLVNYYKTNGGEDSGYMKEINGKTVGVYDYSVKRRADCKITDEALQNQIRLRISQRLVPEIKKAYQFNATGMERYIIACYEAETKGFFHPHRDNTTKGTAHRKFAVSINLNTEEFEGGDLRFPEFGPYTYRPPTGGAVVFSCTLLHEATPVTKGQRYAFLPFLYDEEGKKIRAENQHYIAGAEEKEKPLQTAENNK